jgi:hypothetical protein
MLVRGKAPMVTNFRIDAARTDRQIPVVPLERSD